jgi:hypothetical protein
MALIPLPTLEQLISTALLAAQTRTKARQTNLASAILEAGELASSDPERRCLQDMW